MFLFSATQNQHHQYAMEPVSMASERSGDGDHEFSNNPGAGMPPGGGSPISGILKGGRLWKQHSGEANNGKNFELQQVNTYNYRNYV